MAHLSIAAQSVWGKYSRSTDQSMSVAQHLGDSREVAGLIWDSWLPRSVRRQISASLPGGQADGRLLLGWLAGAHDLGKATVAFACQVPSLADQMHRAGLLMPAVVPDRRVLPHGLAGQFLLQRRLVQQHGWSVRRAKTFTSIVGSHHGVPPDPGPEASAGDRPELLGEGRWCEVQDELIEHTIDAAGVRDRLPEWRTIALPMQVQVLLTAAVILADWLASDSMRFPLSEGLKSSDRAEEAWADLGMPAAWAPEEPPAEDGQLFAERFQLSSDATVREVQARALRVARTVPEPCLLIIEAPMGVGKTEAALGAAEILAHRFGSGGVFIALPTMATSDAMFGRVHRWVKGLPVHAGQREQTMFLAHGKARLNEQFGGLARDWHPQNLDDGHACDVAKQGEGLRATAVAVSHSWLAGRKKGPLANFVVGTIDQVLFCALKSRHLMLRHLALAGKVVIVDEVHAADDYMRVYLCRALHWLGAYQVPTILLSATLPAAQRRELVEAYDSGRRMAVPVRKPRPGPEIYDVLDGDLGYPVIIASTGTVLHVDAVVDPGRRLRVQVEQLSDDDETLLHTLDPLKDHGGCVAVVRNTVGRAQATAALLAQHFGEDHVILLHSRFSRNGSQRQGT